jgi:hypothetical protein
MLSLPAVANQQLLVNADNLQLYYINKPLAVRVTFVISYCCLDEHVSMDNYEIYNQKHYIVATQSVISHYPSLRESKD